MSEVILVRPGYTDFDEQSRIQGLLDLPMNERGEQYVGLLVQQLGSQKIDIVLTDPGEPARTTAESIGDALGVPVKDMADLRNLDLGLWQGLHLEEVRRKYPKLLRQWHEHPETICPPQGEPVCEAMNRIDQALKKPLRKYKRMVIVAADPLATLIAGRIRGTKPDFTGPMCSHAGICIEHLGGDARSTVKFETPVPSAQKLLNGHAATMSGHAGGLATDSTDLGSIAVKTLHGDPVKLDTTAVDIHSGESVPVATAPGGQHA